MTELKQEAIALIEQIPNEREDVFIKIIKLIREQFNDDLQEEIYSRAEQDLAIIEDIESLTREEGDLKDGWH